MKLCKLFSRAAVTLACLGMLLPQVSLAAGPQSAVADPAAPRAESFVITDVALGNGGVLVGAVVDEQGAALPNTTVLVFQQDRQVASTVTGPQGNFSLSGLRGGVYQMSAAEGAGAFRLWAPQTAPPAAQQGALLVKGQNVVRGQNCCPPQRRGAMAFLTNPWVLAGLVAAAIAIPIAVSNNHNNNGS